jgi:hypothetical protein
MNRAPEPRQVRRSSRVYRSCASYLRARLTWVLARAAHHNHPGGQDVLHAHSSDRLATLEPEPESAVGGARNQVRTPETVPERAPRCPARRGVIRPTCSAKSRRKPSAGSILSTLSILGFRAQLGTRRIVWTLPDRAPRLCVEVTVSEAARILGLRLTAAPDTLGRDSVVEEKERRRKSKGEVRAECVETARSAEAARQRVRRPAAGLPLERYPSP